MSTRDFIMSIDAGGTMTDTFFVDRKGDFVVGKAQTTPKDESVGFANSAADALKYWNTGPTPSFQRSSPAFTPGPPCSTGCWSARDRKSDSS